ncbi:bifunctional lysylphosphatidylglycerol synthetase/lysine--tRNA ligase LysX [Nocardioides cavernae]|uniref:Lysine--tRNA ligase n=1 Tax=Nocardioides cavernae TaxID=1921566 RepID=A0ABR8NE43_9ACTN|nr:bifunctional lysylphosphatidylglycerol synthetase/lysine--tRNA ligase LysX [Nocardioides cavernae]MBD3926402.1 bifunctional lysylphosphatidylglycerol synthetase/lysine--tRNA ligase LysX [Nocardioides cavernae]MBM7512119.1 lysyl-tRNA synthetase class 2 [Nocardioides cavernae]
MTDVIERQPDPADPDAGPGATSDRGTRPTPQDDRWPDYFALTTFAFAAFVLVVALVPPWRRYFSDADDALSLLTIPIVPSVVYAALLTVLAVGLRRRLAAAWWLFLLWWLVLPELGRVLALARGDDVVLNLIGLVICLVVLVLAFRARRQFVATQVPGSLRRAVAFFVLGGAVVLFGGAGLVLAFGSASSYVKALEYVYGFMLADVGRVAEQGVPVTAPIWVRAVVGLGGATVVVVSASLLFRPSRDTHSLTVADEACVRTLLRDFGERDSLGYFATRRDKAVVWDTGDPATARAGVSYRVFGSVSLSSGNPVGDPEHWAAAIERWRQEARSNGWSLANMGAGEEGATALAEAGLVAYEIGDEAVVDLSEFSLGGPGMKAVRQSVARVQRRGYTTRTMRHSTLTEEDFAELIAAAGQWRGDGGDERGFSMALGRLEDPLDGDCVMVQAHDEEGRLRGFLSFVPWGRNGLSLDLMRRDPTAGNGLVELMVVALAGSAATFGVGRVSLNFAMFREAFERGAQIGAGPVARLWRQGLLLASRTWQLESLYRSNAKYLPSWQPRFMCFEYASDLPRVGTAAGNAEGFLSRPTLASLRGRKPGEALETGGSQHAAAVLALVPPAPDPVAQALSTEGLPEQVRVRREKLDRIRRSGIDPYPVTFPRTHTMAEVIAESAGLPPDTFTGRRVSIAGRVILKRDHGKLGFAELRDGSGDLQVMVDIADVGAAQDELWRRDIDLGDHLGVTGEVITTRKGELSVRAESLALTSKSLRPLPDKHLGLTDPEARVRNRHVDLIVRPGARDIAYKRATIVRSVRDSLHARGFTEVETPILQLVHGGANARPFETHINAYDMDLYLRIATELHLKRLVVGGMERVFELGRQFRNEGVDFKHNPEFTSMEVYATYGDYDTMRVLTQEIIQEAAAAIYGSPIARRTDENGKTVEHDFSGTWPVKSVCEAVSEALGEEITADTPLPLLQRHAAAIGLDLDADASWGFVLEEVYAELCEGSTTTPVFYKDFPKENAPLTRPHRADPRLAEKWDLVIFGAEQGTAYSELVDPLDQRARLVAQSLLAAAGDPEAMQVDEDFLGALEYGMPPTGGMGLGIDRLVMNLTGLSIRDTILFPLTRPND